MDVTITGAMERSYSVERAHNGNVHTFEGPDAWGNGRSYGRYLFSTQHFYGEPVKLRARDTLIDDESSICAIWQIYEGNRESVTLFGVLEWTASGTVLEARYAE